MSSWDYSASSLGVGVKQVPAGGGGPLQGSSAWPPYRFPSEYSQGAPQSAMQSSMEPTSRSSLALQPFSRTGIGVNSSRVQTTPGLSLQSMSSHVPISTPLQSSSAYNSTQGHANHDLASQGGIDHGMAKVDRYYMAHISFPKTWVHLWDREPLREPERFLATVCSFVSLLFAVIDPATGCRTFHHTLNKPGHSVVLVIQDYGSI